MFLSLLSIYVLLLAAFFTKRFLCETGPSLRKLTYVLLFSYQVFVGVYDDIYLVKMTKSLECIPGIFLAPLKITAIFVLALI